MESLGILLIILIIFNYLRNKTSSGKAKGFLNSVFSILKVGNDGIIPLEISKKDFSEGLDEYYSVLKEVFDSETVEERKSDSSPSKVLSNAFFDHTGLYEALVSLCGELDYIESGSGWVGYKKSLTKALGRGSISKINKERENIRIKFDSYLYLNAEKTKYDNESEFPDYNWNVSIYSKKSEVLACFGIPNFKRYSKSELDFPKKKSVLLSKFKPDYWIIKIRKVARKYSENIEEMKLLKATKESKKALFRKNTIN